MCGQVLKKKQAFNFLSTLITPTSRFGPESQNLTQQLPHYHMCILSKRVLHSKRLFQKVKHTAALSSYVTPSRKSFYRLFWTFFFFWSVLTYCKWIKSQIHTPILSKCVCYCQLSLLTHSAKGRHYHFSKHRSCREPAKLSGMVTQLLQIKFSPQPGNNSLQLRFTM